jgi:hypothetical protein
MVQERSVAVAIRIPGTDLSHSQKTKKEAAERVSPAKGFRVNQIQLSLVREVARLVMLYDLI